MKWGWCPNCQYDLEVLERYYGKPLPKPLYPTQTDWGEQDLCITCHNHYAAGSGLLSRFILWLFPVALPWS